MRFNYIWIVLFFLVLVSPFPIHGQDPGSQSDPAGAETADGDKDEGSTIQKASFIIGFSTIQGLKNNESEYDFDQILAGLKAAHADQELGMTPEERQSVVRAYQEMVRTKRMEKNRQISEKNRIEGEAAMEDFAKQEGAKQLEDGVMYIVLKEGEGEIPEAPDRVKVNYEGSYVDGEVFDSSIEKGAPIENGVLQFVPGFSKALQNMKVGSKWKVIIRGDQAYGMRPRPPMELNKTLMFNIELLEILDPQ